MNIRLVAALLSADMELAQVERSLKRQNDWRIARKVNNVRQGLANAMAKEQESLGALVAEFQETGFTGRPSQQ